MTRRRRITRELKQHPDELNIYPNLIHALGTLHKTAEQRTWLLAYAKAAPEKDSVTLYVGGSLLATNNVDDAIDVYRAGAKAARKTS